MLTNAEADHFVEKGWLKVDQAIPRPQALRVRDYLHERYFGDLIDKLKADDPRFNHVLGLEAEFAGEPFDSCLTPRLKVYLDALTRPYGRDPASDVGRWGWWTVNAPGGAVTPWEIPTEGWHWDGLDFEHSASECHRVGILMLCLFSDVRSRGGATLLAEGTHKAVVGVLSRADAPLSVDDAIERVRSDVPWVARLMGGGPSSATKPEVERSAFFAGAFRDEERATDFRVVEATGTAGDVYLCHPFLLHAGSDNQRPEPRYLCNRFAPFRGPLSLEKDPRRESILDRVVFEALEVDRETERR